MWLYPSYLSEEKRKDAILIHKASGSGSQDAFS